MIKQRGVSCGRSWKRRPARTTLVCCVALGVAGSVWFDRVECVEGGDSQPEPRGRGILRRVWAGAAPSGWLDRTACSRTALGATVADRTRPLLQLARVLRNGLAATAFSGPVFEAPDNGPCEQSLAIESDALVLRWATQGRAHGVGHGDSCIAPDIGPSPRTVSRGLRSWPRGPGVELVLSGRGPGRDPPPARDGGLA